jgi:hypothetical protein
MEVANSLKEWFKCQSVSDVTFYHDYKNHLKSEGIHFYAIDCNVNGLVVVARVARVVHIIQRSLR